MSDVNVISQTQTINVTTATQTIEVDPVSSIAVLVNPAASSISITNAGPQGPAGLDASAGTGYNHIQSSDSSVWVINHNLGYKPSVQIFTVGGLEVIGEIHHTSINQVTVSFNDPMSGSARLV